MDIQQTLFDLFGRRIAESGTYGVVEYIVYGAVMLALCFFVIFPVLDRRGIKFNAKFMLALLPYILLGSALRVLEDMRILPSSWNPLEPAYYLVTPGIYLLIAAVAIACLFISIAISKCLKKDSLKTFAAIGLILALPVTAFELLSFKAWPGFLAVIALVIAITGLLVLAFRLLRLQLLKDGLNQLAVASQALDGSATFVATQFFKCGEQHPLSGAFLDLLPISFIIVKVALVLLIIYYVDREIKNENLGGFIKVIIAVLGFATGLRDVLTLGVGTCL
ncbi:MAG: DUF63 family protein [Candidatus Diapherotrites archaeon]|uniref:DUF63 family protein n=1 Tax=Candidatus Iainarchaeum sp. TaxID=3101447 RepID=A0A939C737_9ARCH|nr:DUF63 family protein [Candidatus Diapherotrites archaeon]